MVRLKKRALKKAIAFLKCKWNTNLSNFPEISKHTELWCVICVDKIYIDIFDNICKKVKCHDANEIISWNRKRRMTREKKIGNMTNEIHQLSAISIEFQWNGCQWIITIVVSERVHARWLIHRQMYEMFHFYRPPLPINTPKIMFPFHFRNKWNWFLFRDSVNTTEKVEKMCLHECVCVSDM